MSLSKDQKNIPLGFEQIHSYLLDALLRGRSAHAYCISGQRSIGKKTYIRFLASCLHKTESIQAHPDYFEIGQGLGNTIPIALIRPLIARASLRPSSGFLNIIALPNIDQCTREASNALLKILEDPPEQTLFLTTARYRKSVIPTVRSRIQWLQPSAVSFEQLAARIDGFDQEQFMAIFGRTGMAFRLMNDATLQTARTNAIETWKQFFNNPRAYYQILRKHICEEEHYEQTLLLGLAALRHRAIEEIETMEKKRLNKTVQGMRAVVRALEQGRTNVSKDILIDQCLLQFV